PLESGRQPNQHIGERRLFRDHSFPDREHVGIVMLARKPGGLFIPAERTTYTAHFVRRNSLTVSRAAEDYPALALPLRHRFGRWSNEERIIDRFFARRAEVRDFVAELPEQFLYFFFVAETCVITPKRDFH